jgi:hypothetical protein
VSGVGLNTQSELIDTDDLIRSIRSAFQESRPAVANTQQTKPFVAATATLAATDAKPSKSARRMSAGRRYAGAVVAATLAGMAAICSLNQSYAPEMYGDTGMVPAAEASAAGKNYAVFDLNLNIRALRNEQLMRMTKTPDVILLGASHWQEANKDVLKGYDWFNAHIHRDYWEDPLGMVELLARHNRLPKKLIISIRDNQFTPVAARKDFLWEPGIPAYQAMTRRIGIETENYYSTLPYERARQLISLPMLFTNVTRWYNASERPHVSDEKHFKALDALLPDGSIVWSDNHMKVFTAERTRKESLSFAALRRDVPPKVVYAFEKMLDYLKQQNVEVFLVHPPFNPIYYDGLEGSPYREGLKKIEELTKRIAADHGLKTFGSFNPHDIGCTSDMYIDAEHSNAKCLTKIFDQFVAIDKTRGTN